MVGATRNIARSALAGCHSIGSGHRPHACTVRLPAEARHRKIHDDDVGSNRDGPRDGRLTVPRSRAALEDVAWNRVKAARLLRISYSALRKIVECGLPVAARRSVRTARRWARAPRTRFPGLRPRCEPRGCRRGARSGGEPT
ncbi:MAG: hypothetical protein E6K82_09235 [Candidatus Rokuibacteriota bacterium]|nr:MAG: hypothetical protein E6K82_09235 [Candidatus Rokubacteria bacterium]